MELSEQQKEILRITQEESAEVIQAVSKVFRFGMDSEWKGVVNRDHLAEELGDLLCMIDLCISKEIVRGDAVFSASINKLKKLETWSNIK